MLGERRRAAVCSASVTGAVAEVFAGPSELRFFLEGEAGGESGRGAGMIAVVCSRSNGEGGGGSGGRGTVGWGAAVPLFWISGGATVATASPPISSSMIATA